MAIDHGYIATNTGTIGRVEGEGEAGNLPIPGAIPEPAAGREDGDHHCHQHSNQRENNNRPGWPTLPGAFSGDAAVVRGGKGEVVAGAAGSDAGTSSG